MQTIKDLQKTLFSECKDIIISISDVSTISEILEKQELISELLEKISVLKYMENQLQDFSFMQETSDNVEEEVEIPVEGETNEVEELLTTTENIEEEQEENKENNATEIIFDDIENEEDGIIEQQNLSLEKEEPSVDISFEIMEQEEEQEILSEVELIEIEENTEIEEENLETEEENETSIEEPKEKKLKLAKIKIQNPHIDTLFDEETMNEITTNLPPQEEKKSKKETPRREFVLDLNDRIAFSKMLFDGSQVELSNVVKRLNAFTNVEDAKQYLSDMYYDKGWEKVDEYAQRLWILVENKFL